MVRGKRAPTRKTTTKKSQCRKTRKHTGTKLDDIVSGKEETNTEEEEEDEQPKKKKESRWKRWAKMGLGAATLGLGGYLGYKGVNKFLNTDFDKVNKDIKDKADKTYNKAKKKGSKFYATNIAPFVNAYQTTDWDELAQQGKDKVKDLWLTTKNADWKGYMKKAGGWLDSTIDKGLDLFDDTKNTLQNNYLNNANRVDDNINESIEYIQDYLLSDPTLLRQRTMEIILEKVEKKVKGIDPFKFKELEPTIKSIKDSLLLYNDALKQANEEYGQSKFKDLYSLFTTLKFKYNKIIR